jgi:hypothetical protein
MIPVSETQPDWDAARELVQDAVGNHPPISRDSCQMRLGVDVKGNIVTPAQATNGI